MAAIADIVSAVPGCSKAAALRAAGLPTCGLGYLRPVNRAIDAGMVIVEYARPNLCRPFADELARRLFDLRRELMASPSPERAAEIMAEVDKIRATQAASYAMAEEGAEQ